MIEKGHGYYSKKPPFRSRKTRALYERTLRSRGGEGRSHPLLDPRNSISSQERLWSQVFSESSEGANYRTIDRALPELDAKKALIRLYDPESPFVLVDPTEMKRKQAKKTGYVGRLSDGKTLGFWMVVFAQPYRGRAIPFHFGIYSEATLNEELASRNLQWRDLVWELKELVGETPLVFDREFSAQRWLEALEEAGCEWVVRLNTKSGMKITDAQEEEIPLAI